MEHACRQFEPRYISSAKGQTNEMQGEDNKAIELSDLPITCQIVLVNTIFCDDISDLGRCFFRNGTFKDTNFY